MPRSPPKSEYRVQKVDTGNPNLTVAVRVRPENDKEKGRARKLVKILDEHVLVFDPAASGGSSASTKKQFALNSSLGASGKGFTSHAHRARDYKYAFDRVFDQESTQEEVYQHTAKPLIESVLNGYNATVFAYGATGSGKTHTMIGNDKSGPGVMVLTMGDLFDQVNNLKDDLKVKISITYLEVYNETIRDLFVQDGQPLMLCEDSDKGAKVSGLTERYPASATEVFELLEYGNKNRRQSPTAANEVSSRSHAVLQIQVHQKDRTADVSASVKMGKLSLIDLAGSERAAVSENRGERLKEGANINRSLLALGNCINSLGEKYKKGQHVPYRNSKLTRLLKDSLGGNCRTVMIAAISPSPLSYEDTLNTLKYANRAKNIKTNVTRNVVNVTYHISKYTRIIQDQKEEIEQLKIKLESSLKHSSPLKQSSPRLDHNTHILREIIIEQHRILSGSGLQTERMIQRLERAGLTLPLPSSPGRGRATKLAWMPVKSTSSPNDSPRESVPSFCTNGGNVSLPFRTNGPMTPTQWVPRRSSSEMMPPPSVSPRRPRTHDTSLVPSLPPSPGFASTPDGQRVYLLNTKSPRSARKSRRSLSKKLETIKAEEGGKNEGTIPKSILKNTVESRVDRTVAQLRRVLHEKGGKRRAKKTGDGEEKNVLFAFSPESFIKLNSKVSRVVNKSVAARRRASFMEPTQSSIGQARMQARLQSANKENQNLSQLNRRASTIGAGPSRVKALQPRRK